MKIENKFFIEQIRTTQKLVEVDAVPDETTIVYGVMIGNRTVMSVYGDFDKIVNICFTILEEMFNGDPSEFMPLMLAFIDNFISSHRSEKIEGDPS